MNSSSNTLQFYLRYIIRTFDKLVLIEVTKAIVARIKYIQKAKNTKNQIQ